jgi:hypothetical protein
LWFIAGDEAGVDGADRSADDPVRLDAGFVQRLIDAGLLGPERAAALQHEHDLAREAPAGDVMLGEEELSCTPFMCCSGPAL